MLELLWKITQVKTNYRYLFSILTLLNYLTCSTTEQLLPLATEDDIIDVLLDAKNVQLREKVDDAAFDIIAE